MGALEALLVDLEEALEVVGQGAVEHRPLRPAAAVEPGAIRCGCPLDSERGDGIRSVALPRAARPRGPLRRTATSTHLRLQAKTLHVVIDELRAPVAVHTAQGEGQGLGDLSEHPGDGRGGPARPPTPRALGDSAAGEVVVTREDGEDR